MKRRTLLQATPVDVVVSDPDLGQTWQDRLTAADVRLELAEKISELALAA